MCQVTFNERHCTHTVTIEKNTITLYSSEMNVLYCVGSLSFFIICS